MKISTISKIWGISVPQIKAAIKAGAIDPETLEKTNIKEVFSECLYCHKLIFNIPSHLAKCSEYNIYKEEILSKSILEDMYIEQKLSLPKIAAKLNVAICTVHRTLKKHGIQLRNHSDAALMSADERAQTNLDRTGYRHNFCKDSPSRLAWQTRLKEEEGISNVFQRQSVKDSIQESYMIKYGVKHPMQVQSIARKVLGAKFSKPHKLMNDIILSESLSFENEKLVRFTEEGTNKYVIYDVYVPDLNLLIEVNGDYYHANPILYKSGDILFASHARSRTVDSIWKRDWKKRIIAKKNGFLFMEVWEYDLKNFPEEIRQQIVDIRNHYANN